MRLLCRGPLSKQMKGNPITPFGSDDMRAWELPNGRFVYRTREGKFQVQLPDDNRWKSFDSVEEAVESWEEEEKRAVITMTVR
jgi:hypothetical protein